MSAQFHALNVRHIHKDTAESVVISFEVPAALRSTFSFVQGQYLTLRREFDGIDVRRAYSICNGVDEEALRVGVRHVANSLFSNWLHRELHVGDAIDVMPPQGRFYVPLDEHARRHYVGIAVGSGITPILSILKSVLAREPHSQFTLIYGNRAQASTMFLDELADVKDRYMSRFSLHHVFSREFSDLPVRCGRLDQDKVNELFDALGMPVACDHVFVCGPEAVKDAVEAELRRRAFPDERIHIERFGAPKALPIATDAVPSSSARPSGMTRITMLKDGTSRVFDMQSRHASVLDAAQDAGLELPYSCKSGVCSTCKAKVIKGRTAMVRNFSLDEADITAGFVLTCQCRPLDADLVLSFDER